jgi:hypothetical protein
MLADSRDELDARNQSVPIPSRSRSPTVALEPIAERR